MKVIAIMGSPHKGNGYKIVQKIESRLKQISNIDFKYIFLSDINFKMCKGCFTCISKGEYLCPLKDDKENIEQELLSSDGIILSSPGYVWNVSGLMKNFLDRLAYSLHRPKFFKQSLMIVANGGSGVNKTVKALSLSLGGCRIACKLSIISTPWESTQSYSNKVDKDIKKNVEIFYKSMANKKLQPIRLGNLIWFSMFKKMASISKETLPADFEYYSEKKEYFYDAKINHFKRYIANIIANVAVWKKKVVFK